MRGGKRRSGNDAEASSRCQRQDIDARCGKFEMVPAIGALIDTVGLVDGGDELDDANKARSFRLISTAGGGVSCPSPFSGR